MSEISAVIDKRSIALFIEKRRDGSNHALGGGCFFMRRDIILTAKHVLVDAVEAQKPLFVVNGSEDGKLFGARPLNFYAHTEIDLALVKVAIDGLEIEHPLYPSHFALHESAGAFAVGYDRNVSNNAENNWGFGIHRISKFDAEKRERRSGSVEYALQFEAPWMEPGCSGGPVITSGGGVAAVLIQSFTTADDSAAGTGQSFCRATSVYPMVDAFRSPFDYFEAARISAA